MKKITMVLFLLLAAFATAQVEDMVQEKDMVQLSIMNNEYGSELRLLQLEDTLAQKISHGEYIIDVILDNDPEADVSSLKEIIDELRLLLEEVQAADGDLTELAELFFYIKTESADLVKEFKELAGAYFGLEEKQQIREQIKNTYHRNDELLDKIKQAKNNYNAEQVKNLVQQMNKNADDLVEQVKNGEINKAQILEKVNSMFKSESTQNQVEIQNRIMEQITRREVSQLRLKEQISENIEQKLQERSEIRNQVMSQMKGESSENPNLEENDTEEKGNTDSNMMTGNVIGSSGSSMGSSYSGSKGSGGK